MRRSLWTLAAMIAAIVGTCASCPAAPRPPSDITAVDHFNDIGKQIDVTWTLSPDDVVGAVKPVVRRYRIERSGDDGQTWVKLA